MLHFVMRKKDPGKVLGSAGVTLDFCSYALGNAKVESEAVSHDATEDLAAMARPETERGRYRELKSPYSNVDTSIAIPSDPWRHTSQP